MTGTDILALLPLLIIAATSIVVMLAIAFLRSHLLITLLTIAGLIGALASLPVSASLAPRQVTSLLAVDSYGLFFTGLMLASTLAVVAISYGYLEGSVPEPEEYYLLLLLAALGCMVLAESTHFASFFLGLEILSVSLYGLIAYPRHRRLPLEASLKYLVLAAVSAAFLLFGMALVYADLGTMEFRQIATVVDTASHAHSMILLTGFALMVVGIGFKLALVPFHMWTPDVYEGAPAPVTAFVATVSKGAMFAVLLRYFGAFGLSPSGSLFKVFVLIAVASMFGGNLLALMQSNVKRILAYSSIAHLGYLLVAFLAGGAYGVKAVSFYLVAYFVTTLGAFGVITFLSTADRDADAISDYRGLFWCRPWTAGIMTAMLLSLAGIPLTAGFVAKFFLISAGVGSAFWALVIILGLNSAIGLYYYLRIVVALYASPEEGAAPAAVSPEPRSPVFSAMTLAVLTFLLLWFGIYPTSLLNLIDRTAGREWPPSGVPVVTQSPAPTPSVTPVAAPISSAREGAK